ncbi:hypothetical protein TIFTF001_015691 [Ficus carica]|uniref:BHLH domain-containing protein n=1 Tax=Ficus carica TaxID=3494 RepID=A0AA88D5D1_FICCA|nr:hypothetical protein TIFTF001_015691 [Ficus carica]
MEKEGKLNVKEEEEEEKEISKLVLGLMEGYSDSVIPPLSQFQFQFQFQPWKTTPEEDSTSRRKREIRPKPGKEDTAECVGRERDRRLMMNESFALLESIVPGLSPK